MNTAQNIVEPFCSRHLCHRHRLATTTIAGKPCRREAGGESGGLAAHRQRNHSVLLPRIGTRESRRCFCRVRRGTGRPLLTSERFQYGPAAETWPGLLLIRLFAGRFCCQSRLSQSRRLLISSSAFRFISGDSFRFNSLVSISTFFVCRHWCAPKSAATTPKAVYLFQPAGDKSFTGSAGRILVAEHFGTARVRKPRSPPPRPPDRRSPSSDPAVETWPGFSIPARRMDRHRTQSQSRCAHLTGTSAAPSP
jgi:hypothetical protein